MGLKNVEKRIVVKVDMELKNHHTFNDGKVIRLERKYNNLNQRETQPVNAIVVSSDYIPEGSEILIHHNCTHEVNRIYDYGHLSGDVETDTVKYFSLPEEDCYAWIDKDGNPQPLRGFEFGLRVYEPYKGVLDGVDNEIIKNVLYLTTGLLKGKIVGVLKASDYEIIYQNNSGREGRVIRLRHSDEEELEREEVVYIDHNLTERVNAGDLLVGLTPQTAKPITTNEVKTTFHVQV